MMVQRLFGAVLSGLAHPSLLDLIVPGRLSEMLDRRRAMLILARVRMVAATFAVLTPLWIPIDLAIFDTTLALYLAALRAMAAAAFVMLSLSYRGSDSPMVARFALIWLLVIPTLFFLVSHPLLARFAIIDPSQQVVAAGYAFLPFVMVAGLSMFPITAFEGAVLGLPLLGAYFLTGYLGYQLLPFASHIGAQWLMLLLGVVATLAGMSQLNFMSQLLDQAAHDGLTGTVSRRIGEEFLSSHLCAAQRGDTPLVIAFIDIDDLSGINQRYGHEEGDAALAAAAQALKRILRQGDVLIRWAGEEFVAAMPGTDAAGARAALARLDEYSLGIRPDGRPLTASIGIAERGVDRIKDWPEAVAIATRRMEAAKSRGKNQALGPQDEP
jgi:diguanylate cyclase (GGDEF)-like protein